MAVALRAFGAPAAGTNAVTTVAIPMPSGVQPGDYLITFFHASRSSPSVDASSPGWTRIGASFSSADTNVRTTAFYGRVAGASEPSSYTFTVPATGGRLLGCIGAFTGVDTANPVYASSAYNSADGTATNLAVSAFSGVDTQYVLELFASNYSSPNSYALTSYTGSLGQLIHPVAPLGTEDTGVSRTSMFVWGGLAGTGGIAAHTITAGNFTSACSELIALTAAPIGRPIKVSNGSGLVDARLQLSDGAGGFVTPGAIKVVKPGYATVAQMLGQSVFYCAHRGGSYDFPEMSNYAYGQSALAGYPALEISLARSSDGVWFGLHDASLDRTSLNTGGGSGTSLVAASMTWAQIQSYSILGSMAGNNTTQSNRPYMRWEELLALYYRSHVIFVDPKVALSYSAELLNMMDTLPGSTNKFIAKYYGVSGGASNASGWCHDAQARGYKTWGYFYESDSSNFATYAPRWDILGMDYTASSTAWTSILGYGKPVMGHICPTPAAASTALGYGAAGLMMSGVLATTPPSIV